LRQWLPKKSRHAHDLRRLLDRWDDGQLHDIFWNLGGHDIQEVESALATSMHKNRPTVVFAYTLKGWRLPSVGHPQNHSFLLTDEQMESLRVDLEIPADETWSRFAENSPEGRLCGEASQRLRQEKPEDAPFVNFPIPDRAAHEYRGVRSTQQTFGAILSVVSRESAELAKRIVTVSPDVASSTNLGGWINKHEVWQLGEQEELPEEKGAGILRWTASPNGQHIELGISENNLFLLLGQLGLSYELFGQLLIPVGTLYDPFIRRGLDALFYSIYSGAKFIVVGTPSGITLAGEGGIHQSLETPSIGAEMPELTAYEPAFAQELEWIMMDAFRRILRRESSTYLRLTTKPVNQELFPAPATSGERERLRRYVLAGAYRLRDCRALSGYSPGHNVVHLFASGAIAPEALAAHDRLRERGVFVNVFNVTGPGPLYANFQRASLAAVTGTAADNSHLDELVPTNERLAPVVTAIDAHPHSLAWIGGALGARVWPLGVIEFGQSGSLQDVYQSYQIDSDAIAAACCTAIQSATQQQCEDFTPSP
jgi:pyruvate dehydrogenase E1 component